MSTKRAYQYIRISQEDQSNFSITGQKRFNESFAARIDCEIIKTFIDDGRSAKDFNRPQWRLLEKEIYKNRHHIDYLIISKYDRLIRNVREGLVFLEKIENKWGVKVVSAMEDYYSHPDDPMFVRDRTQRLLDAEVERLRISDRVKFGNWQAANEGRYPHKAPFGYRNERDDRNKPILVLDQDRAEIIRFIFDSFIQGVPLSIIRTKARSMGFTLQGRSAIQRILSNPVYAGLIEVKPYRSEKARNIKGMHDPVVDERTFYLAQSMIQMNEQGPKVVASDDLPLRGVIGCIQCGSIYTGGRSRGRSKYYHYYRCPECSKVNIGADKIHAMVEGVLSDMAIPQKYLSYIRLQSKSRIEQIEKSRKSEEVVLKRKIDELNQKIDSVTEKFISDQIDQKSYDKFRAKYEREKASLESQIRPKEWSSFKINDFIDDLMPIISDLAGFFKALSTPGKQLFFSSLFGHGSKVSQSLFEPHFIHPVFRSNDLNIKGLRIQKTPEIDHYLGGNYISAPNETMFEPVVDLVEILRKSLSA